jgi:hypothetical protein
MERDLKLATVIANLLDNSFGIGKFRFGIDVIIDLLPFTGDTIILVLSLSLVYFGYRMKLPTPKLMQMLFNIILAYVVGLVPWLGEISYLAFKPNMRNLEILQEHAGYKIKPLPKNS